MLWHRQAIFKSKGDKLCSSAQDLNHGLWNRISSRLNARWQTDWAIEDQTNKKLNSTAFPYNIHVYVLWTMNMTASWHSVFVAWGRDKMVASLQTKFWNYFFFNENRDSNFTEICFHGTNNGSGNGLTTMYAPLGLDRLISSLWFEISRSLFINMCYMRLDMELQRWVGNRIIDDKHIV